MEQSSLWNNFLNVFNYNPNTLSGALDVILTQTKDKSYKCSNFNFRVGKFKVFKPSNKIIDVFVNGIKSSYPMQFSDKGIAYFLIPSEEEDSLEDSDITSDFISEQGSRKNSFQEVESIIPQRKSSFKSKDDTFVEQKASSEINEDGKIQLSLCAHLLDYSMTDEEIQQIFDDNIIHYKQFDTDPQSILQNEQLMIKIGSKIYESYIGIPQILSLLVYDKELTQLCLSRMAQIDFEKTETKSVLPKKFKKSLKPPMEFWQEFDLKSGMNELVFKFHGNLGQEHQFHSRVFYYPFQPFRRVIVSDIDGTITKSDLLGHLMPFISRDWSHEGIAKFFTELHHRGYIIVYLTARNIGQAYKTLQYLQSVKQDQYNLPPGPLFTSPNNLIESLKQELFIKKVENFKIKVLRTIKNLFSDSGYNPIYAGFGNKESDAISYSAAGVQIDYIFTITPDSQIYLIKSHETYTYSKLNQLIEEYFPEYNSEEFEDKKYDDLQYWKKNKYQSIVPEELI